MSSVTSLMLSFSISEKEEAITAELNCYPNKGRGFSIVSVDDKSLPRGWYGGTKMMEARIYLGSYNHLNIDDFIDYLQKITWEYPEDVQLFIKEQWAEKFTLYNLISA